MYLERLELLNAGPIDHFTLEMPFGSSGNPLPIILVGKNGSGKSIALAHIVSAILAIQAYVYEDSDVAKEKVYKIRSPIYIKNGAMYSVGDLRFSNNLRVSEIQLSYAKSSHAGERPMYEFWDNVPVTATSHYHANYIDDLAKAKTELDNNTHLFFPPNRFEEPAWLNELNLLNKAEYFFRKNFSGYSNRPIIKYAPLRDLQNWLLDVIYDSFALERVENVNPHILNGAIVFPKIYSGQATKILNAIGVFINELFGKPGQVVWSVGQRSSRSIGITIGGELLTNNLFGLSTGQVILIDLFLSIIRDVDISNASFTSLADVSGIVIVDEVDLHLHTDLQHDLLPKLIKLFPRVQFILTSHSPLFLMGMKNNFSEGDFKIFELPNGVEILVEDFSEFEEAYLKFKDSKRFKVDIQEKIARGSKPFLFLEGTTDIDYIRRAAVLLNKESVLNRFEIIDAEGCENMNKIWAAYRAIKDPNASQKMVLLYDCDVRKVNERNGLLFQKVLPRMPRNIISGIENLFPNSTIESSMCHKTAFVDICGERRDIDRGVEILRPEEWKVNRNEKRNLCDWICENGTAADFDGFAIIFQELEEVLNQIDLT